MFEQMNTILFWVLVHLYVTSAFNCLYSFCQKLYTLLQFTQNRIATRRVGNITCTSYNSLPPILPPSLSLTLPPLFLVPSLTLSVLVCMIECACQPTSLHSCWLNIEVRRVDRDDKRGQWWSCLVNILTVNPSKQWCILIQNKNGHWQCITTYMCMDGNPHDNAMCQSRW